MRTECIKEDIRTDLGYGNHRGTIIHREFKCPCGKGLIVEDHNDIIGFRNHDVWIDCPECSKVYTLDTSKGKTAWDIIKKDSDEACYVK